MSKWVSAETMGKCFLVFLNHRFNISKIKMMTPIYQDCGKDVSQLRVNVKR